MPRLWHGARNGSTPYHNVSKRWSLLRFSPDFKKWSTYLVCDEGKGAKWRDATKEKQPKNLQGCNKNIYVSKSVCFLDGKTGALEMVTSYDLPVMAVENGFKSWKLWIPSKTYPIVHYQLDISIVLVLPLVTSQIHLRPKRSRVPITFTPAIPSHYHAYPFGNWYTPSRDPCSIMILEDK